jgi:L-fucose mutarotase/ribose pyranase (RbsD/FucU family)
MSAVKPHEWETRFHALLPLYGHRNWIVVADSAYPAQARAAIETIVADAEQIDVVRAVHDAIHASRHARANIYVDQELAFVDEKDAPGVSDFRKQLDQTLYGAQLSRSPHEQIIHKLDESAQLFRVLVIKTEMTIPYTSVFFELDCGYWNAGAEQRLRQAILVASPK